VQRRRKLFEHYLKRIKRERQKKKTPHTGIFRRGEGLVMDGREAKDL